MGYNRDTPGPNESVSVSQKKLRSNSFTIDNIFGQQHRMFSSSEGERGKHDVVSLPQQGADPTTLADEYGLYTIDDGGDPFVKVREPSSGTIGKLLDETANGLLRFGDLRLGAFATIAARGTIIESFNVSSVVYTNLGSDQFRYEINFTNALPTDDYFFDIDEYTLSINYVEVQASGTYSNSITASKIVLFGTQKNLNFTKVNFRVWYKM